MFLNTSILFCRWNVIFENSTKAKWRAMNKIETIFYHIFSCLIQYTLSGTTTNISKYEYFLIWSIFLLQIISMLIVLIVMVHLNNAQTFSAGITPFGVGIGVNSYEPYYSRYQYDPYYRYNRPYPIQSGYYQFGFWTIGTNRHNFGTWWNSVDYEIKVLCIFLVVFLWINNIPSHYKLYDFVQFGQNLKETSSIINESCMFQFTQNLFQHLEEGNRRVGLFLDRYKALDSLDYSTLLCKLEVRGIRNPAYWFRSYLIGRKNIVAVNRFNELGKSEENCWYRNTTGKCLGIGAVHPLCEWLGE